MGTGELTAGGNPAIDYVASTPGGSRNIPSRLIIKETGISSDLMKSLKTPVE